MQSKIKKDGLDAIIFGADVSTDRFTVCAAVKLLKGFRWGIAGSTENNFDKILQEIGEKVGKDLSEKPKFVIDIEDEKSLIGMASQAKVIVNCCRSSIDKSEKIINFG